MKKTWYRYPAYFFLAVFAYLGARRLRRGALVATLRPPVVTEDIRLGAVRWEPLRTAEATPLILVRVIGTPKAPGAFVQASRCPWRKSIRRRTWSSSSGHALPRHPPPRLTTQPRRRPTDSCTGHYYGQRRDRIYARGICGQRRRPLRIPLPRRIMKPL